MKAPHLTVSGSPLPSITHRKGIVFAHILIAADGSELSDRAVGHGLALAKVHGAKVTAVHVTEPWTVAVAGEWAVALQAEEMTIGNPAGAI